MNLAHLHLVLNHIPIVGIPLALVFLTHGVLKKNLSTQRFAFFVLIGLAGLVLPVYFTGEPAEEMVEHLPGVVESLIETHEKAAAASLVLTLVAGVAAFVALFFQKDASKGRISALGVLALASVASVSLFYTANLGGKVRHSEVRSGVVAQLELKNSHGETGNKEDDDD